MAGKAGRRLAAALCALSAVCLGCLQKEPLRRFGVSGGTATLEPKMPAGANLSDISWKKGEDIVAEGGRPPWFAPRFEGRAQLDSATGSLTLLKLQQSDSGQYRAEVVIERTILDHTEQALGDEIQCTFFSLQILEPPKPPQLNCTDIGDRIWVSCELDAMYEAENINLAYKWKYQRSNKQILGNSSKIWLEKDIDLSENITCIIHVLDANTSSSIRLRGCTPTGAVPQTRDRAMLLIPLAGLIIAGLVIYFWKREGADAAEARPEAQHLHEEPPENLEEENSRGPPDPGT